MHSLHLHIFYLDMHALALYLSICTEVYIHIGVGGGKIHTLS